MPDPGKRSPRVAVAGAGRIGAGIGLVFAQHHYQVTYLVRDQDRARRRVAGERSQLERLGVLPPSARLELSFCDTVADLAECDLIIESVPEDRTVKLPVLAALAAAQPEAILATNTSSMRISDLAGALLRPERFVGLHFLYPAVLMPLVEVVPGASTSAATVDACCRILADCRKLPVRLRRDIPGFLWNRLQFALLREAKHLVDEGIADAGELDLVVEQGLARRWAITGPFASALLGGVGTFETVARNLLPELSDAQDLAGLGALLEGYVDDEAALGRYRDQRLAARPPEPRPR